MLCSGSGFSAQPCNAMTGCSNRLARCLNESLSDPTALIRRINKQRPDVAIPRVTGGHSFDQTLIFPAVDRSMGDVPIVVRQCHPAPIRDAVRAARPTGL